MPEKKNHKKIISVFLMIIKNLYLVKTNYLDDYFKKKKTASLSPHDAFFQFCSRKSEI